MKSRTHDRFTPKAKTSGQRKRAKSPRAQAPASDFSARYADLIGAATGLPADLAEQHDHYLHGTRKRQ